MFHNDPCLGNIDPNYFKTEGHKMIEAITLVGLNALTPPSQSRILSSPMDTTFSEILSSPVLFKCR